MQMHPRTSTEACFAFVNLTSSSRKQTGAIVQTGNCLFDLWRLESSDNYLVGIYIHFSLKEGENLHGVKEPELPGECLPK